MAGDWRGVSEGISRGFQRGVAIGGRLSPLGDAIKGIAERLRSQRETGEEMGRTMNILGVKGLIEGNIEPTQEGGFELPGVGRVKRVNELRDIFGNIQRNMPLETSIPSTQTITQDKIARGLISKKFGIPYEEMMTPEERQAKLERQTQEKEMQSIYGAENQTAIRKTISQIGNLNTMINKLFQMPAGRQEYITKVGAFITGGKTQAQADIAEYEDMVQANAAGLYRDLTGDNRLSDKDAQARATPLIPRPQQDRRLQLQKAYKLAFMLRNRAEMLQTSSKEVALDELGKGFYQSPEYQEMINIGKDFRIEFGKIPQRTISQNQFQEISESDIQYTMQKYGLSRQEVLRRLRK